MQSIYHLNNRKNQAKSDMGGSRANPNTLMKNNLTALVKDKTDNILDMSFRDKYLKISSQLNDYTPALKRTCLSLHLFSRAHEVLTTSQKMPWKHHY